MSADPATLAAWDHACLWHPFTQMREWLAADPLIIAAGEGAYLIAADGRRYLDGVSSLWCNVHGHRRPELDAAVREQTERIAHSTLLGLGSVPSIELARRLVDLVPGGLTRVFYSDDGATAVEIALKMAFQYWRLRGDTRRTRFVSLTEAYHGDTLGAVSVGYSDVFHRFLRPLVFPCDKLDPPHVFRWHRGMDPDRALRAAVEQAAAFFAEHGGEIAALIIEPMVQGAAGMWTQPQGYVSALRDLTRRHGTLLICDEVATGFGRTGAMFAVEHEQVTPDLMCVGKGITGGYLPLAATFATEEIFNAFLGTYQDFTALFHGHTYTGNALACAVAIASLDVFAKDAVLANVRERAEQLRHGLQRGMAPLAHVGDVRQCGLMAGAELVADRQSRRPFPPEARVGMRVCLEARRFGVILRPLGDVVVLMPPLCVTGQQIEALCDATREAIVRVTEDAAGATDIR